METHNKLELWGNGNILQKHNFGERQKFPSMALGKGRNPSALSTLSSINTWDGQELEPRWIWDPNLSTGCQDLCQGEPWGSSLVWGLYNPLDNLPATNFPGSKNLRLQGQTEQELQADQGLGFLLSPWEYKPSSYLLCIHPIGVAGFGWFSGSVSCLSHFLL